MPVIRGWICEGARKLGHFDEQPAVLKFVESKRSSTSIPNWR